MHHTLQSHSPYFPQAPQDFAQWGMDEIAYIKIEMVEGKSLHVIHAADGEGLAAAGSYELAAAMVVQNGLAPVYVQ
ncbi:MAG: hypothetical protein HOH04_07905 [Rhodospirillaceae bacterium]|jgi:hypothetical protein|nr:hypothetical protein [Rhodospirillaceae bacterium]